MCLQQGLLFITFKRANELLIRYSMKSQKTLYRKMIAECRKIRQPRKNQQAGALDWETLEELRQTIETAI